MAVAIEERELVRRYQAGNDEAFEDIVRAFTPQLMAHARRRLSDPAAAEDALQETFLRAYRALPRFNGEYRLGAWLYQILTNVCADEGGRRQREGRLLQRASGPALGEQVEPDAATQARFPDPVVTEAFGQLPETYQEALVLRFIEELPYEEVAARSGVTEANARARVHRASVALRRTFVAVGGVLGGVIAWTAAIVRRSERLVVDGSQQASSSDVVLNQASTVSHTTTAAAQVATQVTNLAAQVAPTVVQAATQVAASPERVTMFTKVAVAAVAAVAVPVAAVGMHSATSSLANTHVKAPSATAQVHQADESGGPAASGSSGGEAALGRGAVGSGMTDPAQLGSGGVPEGALESEPSKTGSAPTPVPVLGAPGSPTTPASLRTGSIMATAPLARVLGGEIVAQGSAKISVGSAGLEAQFTANFGIPELLGPGQAGPVRMSAVVRESGGAALRLHGELNGIPEGGTSGATTYRYAGTFDVVNGDPTGVPAKGTFALHVTVPGGYLKTGIGPIGSMVIDFKEVRDTTTSPTPTP